MKKITSIFDSSKKKNIVDFQNFFFLTTKKKHNPQVDYFSWGRDNRLLTDNSEDLEFNKRLLRDWYLFMSQRNLLTKKFFAAVNLLSFQILEFIYKYGFLNGFKQYLDYKFSIFDDKLVKNIVKNSYLRNIILFLYFKIKLTKYSDSFFLLSDQYSKTLYCELLLLKILGEKYVELSSFTASFIETYEQSVSEILKSNEFIKIYDKWILKKVNLHAPNISIFTSPVVLNLYKNNCLYSYKKDKVNVSVEPGDIVIDAGAGSGDTAIYFAGIACSNQKNGKVFSFEILKEGLYALEKQLDANPRINNVIQINKALSNTNNNKVFIKNPGFGANLVNEKTDFCVSTITLDQFFESYNLPTIDFIKMDIEGSEVPALQGAKSVIKKFKPKLAISAYHKKDDLITIPKLIHQIRPDYNFYLNCTTGFGGEIVLYCK